MADSTVTMTPHTVVIESSAINNNEHYKVQISPQLDSYIVAKNELVDCGNLSEIHHKK